jgi:hypothetical protein
MKFLPALHAMTPDSIRFQTTPAFTQLVPLRLDRANAPVRISRPAARFAHPLEGLESAPGTLPPALLAAVR